MSPAEARAALAAAHREVKLSDEALAKARAASVAAREFVAAIEQELAQLRASSDHVADAPAMDVVEALKAGAKPEIKPLPGLTKNAAARAEAENRLQAAPRASD
jgi:hypothetical protein